MSVHSPLQTSFAGGEISPHVHGRVDADVYAAALASCRNFQVLPQGPLLMRAGTALVARPAAQPRLIPFRVSGEADDYVLALTPGKLRVYSRETGQQVAITPNVLAGGHFDAGLTVDGVTVWFGGEWDLEALKLLPVGFESQRIFPVTPGVQHRLSFSARQTSIFPINHFEVSIDGGAPFVFTLTEAYKRWNYEWTPAGASSTVKFKNTGGAPSSATIYVDDVTCIRLGHTVDELDTPWDGDQIVDVQHDGELAKNRALLVHREERPQVVCFTAPSVWEVYGAEFAPARPGGWGDGNWPGAVEVGFQGRTWLGGAAKEPNTLRGSRSGRAFDFTSGPNPDDAIALAVSTKGALLWMRGQKALLVGTEAGEHSVSGPPGGVVTGAEYDIRDQGYRGGAPVQALGVGSEVLFVTRDRRHLRAADYSNEAQGFVSRALTFLADHLTEAGVKEVHFARAPHPTVLVVLQDGGLVGCTYDRGEGVQGWWRIEVGAPVASAAVADGPDGSELWLSVVRASGPSIERLPLHEVAVRYLDAHVERVVGVGGVVDQLEHLEGLEVTVVGTDDAILGEGLEVAGGQVTLDDPELEGETVIVGLRYRATAVTLPREGGNPRGTAQGAKRRNVRIGLRLHRSAIPLVDGDRAVPERSPSTPMGSPEPLVSLDVESTSLGWGNGSITVEQDLPRRTEILAIFATSAVHDL